MARAKAFDPDVALQKAMELFWEQGYEATSVEDLVNHLGVGRASLYATFGSKRELYLSALERYVETGIPFVDLLSQPGPVLPAVRSLVNRYADESARDESHKGCLIVNTAVELAPHDKLMARRVEAHWDFVEATLTSALARARAQGELSPEKDPRALARFLLTVLQGIRTVGKGSSDPARLRSTADQALSILD